MTLLFSKTHEWVKFIDDTTAEIGISDYAQSKLGGLVFVNLPEPGDEVACGESFADVESVKTVENVNSPVTGTVSEINEELFDSPEFVNESAYDAWFIKVENITEKQEELLTEEEYEAYCETLDD